LFEFDREATVIRPSGQWELVMSKLFHFLSAGLKRQSRPLWWYWLLVMLLGRWPLAGVTQILTPDVLASVPIRRFTELGQSGTSFTISGEGVFWRQSLVCLEKSGKSLVVVDVATGKLQGRVPLPSEIVPLSHLSYASERKLVAGLTGYCPPYRLVLFELTGTLQSGYRVKVRNTSGIPISNPDGTPWNHGQIEAFAVAPNAESFRIAARDTEQEKHAVSLWYFMLTNQSTSASQYQAREVLPLPETGLRVESIKGLLWWPSGLLLAATQARQNEQRRPSVTIALLPWGKGTAPLLIGAGIAKGYRAVGLADSPATVCLLLAADDSGQFALALIPKMYPSVR
jgi:hypothetical protein